MPNVNVSRLKLYLGGAATGPDITSKTQEVHASAVRRLSAGLKKDYAYKKWLREFFKQLEIFETNL